MRAWRVHGTGEPSDTFRLDEVDEPTPEALAGLGMGLGGWEPLQPGREPFGDWVILDVRAAALALPDVTMSRGSYPVPVGRPYVTGQEGVGVVREAAPGREDLVGRRVVACCIQPWGSLADVAVGVSMIFEVPDELGDAEAAAFLIASHTGYHAAIRRGAVEAGETVAVLGAAGGVGSAMVQLSAAQGARVIAVVGDHAKAEVCAGLGAEPVVHADVDTPTALRRLTDGRGVDVILDPVQGEAGAHARAGLAVGGRHVLCGHAGGLVPHDPSFYLWNQTLVGVDLGGHPPDVMRAWHRETQAHLDRLMAEGRYRPLVDRVVPFEQARDAVADLAERRVAGRVVVEVARPT
jgi:NADPH2:quinone reductase